MSEDLKSKTTTAAASTSSAPSLEKIQATMRQLDQQRLCYLRGLIEGVMIIPDHSGMMVHADGYAVVVGERLYKKLKGTI
jgi:hypothetical protein